VALPPGATEHDEGPRDLFACGLSIDLGADMSSGMARVELTADGTPLAFDLAIERPRLGRFIPAARVTR
jgi:hypothetical protein